MHCHKNLIVLKTNFVSADGLGISEIWFKTTRLKKTAPKLKYYTSKEAASFKKSAPMTNSVPKTNSEHLQQ